MRTIPTPALTLTGIPTPAYTIQRVAAYAESGVTDGAEATIGREDGGGLTLDLQGHGMRHVGSTDHGACFECDDVGAIRALAGALLGALAAAERAGVIARAGGLG